MRRQAAGPDQLMLYKFGTYTLDTDRCELRLASDRVELEPQVLSILSYLVQERSRIVTRGDLLAAIWNGRFVSDSTINSRIAAARKVIGDRGKSQRMIRSFPRRGYRFVADVQTEAPPNDQSGVISLPRLSLRSSHCCFSIRKFDAGGATGSFCRRPRR
jgi:DNA-binding winged helix-turn-helix (wHTH) protein